MRFEVAEDTRPSVFVPSERMQGMSWQTWTQICAAPTESSGEQRQNSRGKGPGLRFALVQILSQLHFLSSAWSHRIMGWDHKYWYVHICVHGQSCEITSLGDGLQGPVWGCPCKNKYPQEKLQNVTPEGRWEEQEGTPTRIGSLSLGLFTWCCPGWGCIAVSYRLSLHLWTRRSAHFLGDTYKTKK